MAYLTLTHDVDITVSVTEAWTEALFCLFLLWQLTTRLDQLDRFDLSSFNRV